MMMRRVTVSAVPAKVATAMDYLRFAEVARCGGPQAINSDLPFAHRELTIKEETVYYAALEVLRLYLSGECEFGPPLPPSVTDEDNKPPPRELVEEE